MGAHGDGLFSPTFSRPLLAHARRMQKASPTMRGQVMLAWGYVGFLPHNDEISILLSRQQGRLQVRGARRSVHCLSCFVGRPADSDGSP